MSLRLPSSLVAVVLLLAAACSHEISKPPPASDGPAQPGSAPPSGGGGTPPAVTDAGFFDAGDAATACNDLALNGSLVDQSAVAGDPTVGTGGTITDGNYDLTDATLFIGAGSSGATGTTFKESISLAMGTLQQLRDTQTSSGTTELRATYTVAMSGTTVTLTPTCPSTGAPQQWSFTVNGSQLRLTSLTDRVEFVYTKK